MHPLMSTILPPFSYENVNKVNKRQENDQSDDSKDKRGKLGFQFVLKKCVSFRSLSNKNDSSSRTMTTESALSSRSFSVESLVPCQVAVQGQAPSSPPRKVPSSPKLLLPTNGATIKRPGHLCRSSSVAVREKAPPSPRKVPSSTELLLPTNGATIKRPGLSSRSSSVKSLHVQSLECPREVRRKGKRMNECRSRSARSFSTKIEKVQTRSPEKALNKCISLRNFLQDYDDIIILDEYAELAPARQHKMKEERSIDGWLDKYSRIVDEDTD
jgi:hypothetical protein